MSIKITVASTLIRVECLTDIHNTDFHFLITHSTSAGVNKTGIPLPFFFGGDGIWALGHCRGTCRMAGNTVNDSRVYVELTHLMINHMKAGDVFNYSTNLSTTNFTATISVPDGASILYFGNSGLCRKISVNDDPSLCYHMINEYINEFNSVHVPETLTA